MLCFLFIITSVAVYGSVPCKRSTCSLTRLLVRGRRPATASLLACSRWASVLALLARCCRELLARCCRELSVELTGDGGQLGAQPVRVVGVHGQPKERGR